LAACALIAGCTGGGHDPSASAASPEGLKGELQTLRDQNGLFIFPGYFRGRGSVYSTALLASALGDWQLSPAQRKAAVGELCLGADVKTVHPVWLAWAASELFDRDLLGSALPGCISRNPPPSLGDPNEDIPMLWAWAQTGANWRERPDGVELVVRTRLASMDLDRITSPYVRWRLEKLDGLIGAPDDRSAHVAPPPPRLAQPDDLLDLWGYVERCAAHAGLCTAQNTPDLGMVTAAERSFGDDLSMAAAIGIARILNNRSVVARYQQGLLARTEAVTGLVRSARPEGDIESTFLALQIAPDLFPGPAAQATAQVMRDDLRLGTKLDTTSRVKALAILRAVGAKDWTDYAAEIRNVEDGLRSRLVTQSSLQSTVELVDALRLLDPHVPLVKLRPFPKTDARSTHLARLALANADVFANAEAVRKDFVSPTSQLVSDAKQPKDPLVAYYSTVNAIAGAEIQLDPPDHRAVSVGIRSVQGCSLNGTTYTYLFRASAASRESCSLAATWQAIRSGFAFEAPS
jgi:hypothetical protein